MNLVLAITGASGAYAAELLIARSPWPITLVASEWGKDLADRECQSFQALTSRVAETLDDADLSASIACGAVATAGMVVLPCTTNTMGKIAAGIADTLVTRAAHCHLKEAAKLVLCVRETPWTLIDLDNARKIAAAGGTIMPLSPPFYAFADGRPADSVTMTDLLGAYVDRVLKVLRQGSPPGRDA